MFPTLEPASTTLMVFALLSISSFQVVNAIPAPDALWVELEARGCSNPTLKKNPFKVQNLIKAFKEMKVTYQDGQKACINLQLAQCTSSKWIQTPCAPGSPCPANPNDNEPGCNLPSNVEEKFKSACMEGGRDGSRVTSVAQDEEPDVDDVYDDCGEQCDVPEESSEPPSPNGATLTRFTTALPSPTGSESDNSLKRFKFHRRQIPTDSVVDPITLTTTSTLSPATTDSVVDPITINTSTASNWSPVYSTFESQSSANPPITRSI